MTNIPFALAAINWGERASTAGTVTLMGMLIIFVVLAILWAAIEIMHALLTRGKKKEATPTSEKKANAAPGQADDGAIAAAIAAALAASEDEGATVAAITAAISAMRAEEGCDSGFRVVSFKRVGRANGRRR